MPPLTPDFHASRRLVHPSHQQEQQGLLHIFVPVYLWGDGGCQLLIEILLCGKAKPQECFPGERSAWGELTFIFPLTPHLRFASAPPCSALRPQTHPPHSYSSSQSDGLPGKFPRVNPWAGRHQGVNEVLYLPSHTIPSGVPDQPFCSAVDTFLRGW